MLKQEIVQEKSLIKKKILQYLDYKGISKYKFYQESGITRGILDQETGISEENIFKFLAYARDISPSYLFKEDTSIENSRTVSEDAVIYNAKCNGKRTNQKVPIYNIEAVAGVVEIFDDLKKTTPIAYLEIPKLPPSDGGMYATGDSMYPLIKSGDIVTYKIINDLSNIFWGEMYILSIYNNGDLYITIKYVQKSEREGYIRLVSQNQHHQDKEVPFDSIKVAAFVTASVRINSMG